MAPRICLCIAEEDLRTWVMEELMLMTWIDKPSLTIINELAPVDANVIVIGVDKLSARDREELRTRTWTTPVIAIGRDADVPNAHVLGPRLTSRELKQALRATLFDRQATKSAVV